MAFYGRLLPNYETPELTMPSVEGAGGVVDSDATVGKGKTLTQPRISLGTESLNVGLDGTDQLFCFEDFGPILKFHPGRGKRYGGQQSSPGGES